MNKILTLRTLALVAGASAPLGAQADDARARAVFDALAAAAVAPEAARLDGVRYTETRLPEWDSWAATGSVLVQPHEEPERARVLIRARTSAPRERRVELAFDGEQWTWVDRDAGTWTRGDGPWIAGRDGERVARLWPRHLTLDAAPAAFRSLGATPVGEEPCEHLACEAGEGHPAETWYVSTRDHRPRSIVRTWPLGEVEQLVQRWTATSVATSELRDPAAFALATEGLEWFEPAARVEDESEARGRDELVVLTDTHEPLRAAFQADVGQPRVVCALSPT